MESSSKRFKPLSPLPYTEQVGDIVEHYNFSSCLIVQLNNCVSRKLHPHSFSWNLGMQYTYSNLYQHRITGPYPNLASEECRPLPGSVQIFHSPFERKGPSFACLYGQYKMGKENSTYYLNSSKVDAHYVYMSLYKDTYGHRLQYFNLSLNKLAKKLLSLQFIDSVIFPKYIGCGMAGGKWTDYEEIISRFCLLLKKYRPDVNVYIMEKK